MAEEKRYVYGTRTKTFELVGKEDRDFEVGIPKNEFKGMGIEQAKERYLATRYI